MFGLFGLIVGLVGAVIGIVMGVFGAVVGVVLGLIVPLSPFLLFILVVWLLVKGPGSSKALAGGRNSGPQG
jgi:hypothetical protein